MSIDEALKQLSFYPRKGSAIVKEVIILLYVNSVIIICRDHIICVFDGLPNSNALGIPVDGTADEKLEKVLFCCIEAIFE